MTDRPSKPPDDCNDEDFRDPPREWPEDVFRRRLVELRHRRGLSQRQVAEGMRALGVSMSQPGIQQIETAKTQTFSLRAALAIAAVLDVPLEDLYREPLALGWRDYLVAQAEEPGVSPEQAWLRAWKYQREKREKQSTSDATITKTPRQRGNAPGPGTGGSSSHATQG